MRTVTLKLTPSELEMLTTLAADQIFRKEFIEPKMPGFKSDAEQIRQAKALISQLRAMIISPLHKGPSDSLVSRTSPRINSTRSAE